MIGLMGLGRRRTRGASGDRAGCTLLVELCRLGGSGDADRRAEERETRLSRWSSVPFLDSDLECFRVIESGLEEEVCRLGTAAGEGEGGGAGALRRRRSVLSQGRREEENVLFRREFERGSRSLGPLLHGLAKSHEPCVVCRKEAQRERDVARSITKLPVAPTVVRLELHCALQESLAVLLDSLASNICSSSREKEVSARPRLPIRRTNHSQQNSEIAELSTLNASSSNFLSSYSRTLNASERTCSCKAVPAPCSTWRPDLEHQHAKGGEWGFGAEFEEAGLFLAGFSSGGEEFEGVFRGGLRRAWDELDEEELEGVERSEVVEVEVVLCR